MKKYSIQKRAILSTELERLTDEITEGRSLLSKCRETINKGYLSKDEMYEARMWEINMTLELISMKAQREEVLTQLVNC